MLFRSYLALLVLSLHFGGDYVSMLLPLYRWELSQLAQDYQIQTLQLVDSHGEAVVALTLLTRYFVFGSQVIHPDISISCSTLMGHALQHLLLMLSLVIAWPTSKLSQRILRLACALPFLLLVEMLDIPLVLLGSVKDLISANFAHGAGSLAIDWMNFINGGGRLALSIAGAVVAICCTHLLLIYQKKWLKNRAIQ